ncbi:MAG: hypothetical protein AB1631_28515 [Acidobacteriota bacterium]
MINGIKSSIVTVLLCCLCLGQTPRDEANQILPDQTEYMLHQMADRIKEIEEPEMRVFLRYRIALYLWSKEFKKEFDFAQAMAVEALDDLYLHRGDLDHSDVAYYRGRLSAMIHTYSPALAAKLNDKYKFEETEKGDAATAYSMLSLKNGVKPAVEIISRNVKNGQDDGLVLVIFLTNLAKEHPGEYVRLLRETTVAEASRPGTFSLMTLYMLKGLYMGDDTPSDLRLHFLEVVVSKIERNLAETESKEITSSYHLLRDVYGEIENLSPLLFLRARNAMSALTARVPGKVLERSNREDRIRASGDPLRQLITEADAVTDESEKDSLRTQAARLAFERKEFRLAVELAAKTSDDGQKHSWRDQFLEEIIDATLEKKDEETAFYALSKIKAALYRASATQKLAVFFLESKDLVRARELMNDFLKLAGSLDDDADIARKLLESVAVFKKVDEARVPEVVLYAVKIINRISKPGLQEKAGSPIRKAYTQSLTSISWHAIPAFRILCQQDQIGAYGIANGIQQADMRAAAFWGITTGLLETTKSAASTNHKAK